MVLNTNSCSVKADYFNYVKNNTNDLLVVFSPFAVPVGKFGFSGAFSKDDCDYLFLNCPDNLFYLEGVPGLGKDVEETLSAIGEIISKYKGSRICFFGSSMGANGALHYGTSLGVNNIIAFSAKSNIEILSYTFKNNKHSSRIKYIPDYVAMASEAKSKIWLIAGDNEFTDYISLCMFPNKFNIVKLLSHGSDHYLVRMIHERYGLHSAVKQMLQGEFIGDFYTPSISSATASSLMNANKYSKIPKCLECPSLAPIGKFERAAYYLALAKIETTRNAKFYIDKGLIASKLPSLLLKKFRMSGDLDSFELFSNSLDSSFDSGYAKDVMEKCQ